MSGTRIEARVRPGARVAAALAARREEILARHEVRVQELVGSRPTEAGREAEGRRHALGSRNVPGHARAADTAPRVARTGLLPVAQARTREAAVAAVREQEQRELAHARHQLVFADLLAHLPPEVESTAALRMAEGSLAATVQLAGAGAVEVELGEDGVVALHMEECGVTELESQHGLVAGCDAEEELGARFHASWAAAGLDVVREGTASTDESARRAERPWHR